MAILFITHKFPPSVGGMQKQSYELINGVRRYTRTYMIAKSPAESKVWFFLTLLFRIYKLLRRHKDISVIHCNDGVVASYCALLLRTQIPITATFHGLDIVYPGFIFQRLIIPRLHIFQRIFAVSEATALECISRGFDPRKVVVIPNGVDHDLSFVKKGDSFSKGLYRNHGIDLSSRRMIVSTGRAVKRKGFSWFVNHVLPKLSSDVIYVMAGPQISPTSLSHRVLSVLPIVIRRDIELFLGYPSDSVDLMKSIKNSRGKAIHMGKLPWDKLQQLMAHADLLIMPNQKVYGDMEGFGLVALESGLLGTYPVASGIEGITSAIPSDRIGTLLPPLDDTEWVDQINQLLSNRAHLQDLGAKSREMILHEFGWEKMSRRYYEELMQVAHETQMSLSSIGKLKMAT